MSILLLADTVPIKKFTITETLLYALIGFLLTICVLAFLWGVIALMKLIFGKLPEDHWFSHLFKTNKKTAAPQIIAEEKPSATAPGSSGEIKTYGVADKEVAMIMAIVADELQTPLNELKFISVKEIKEENK